MSTKMWLDDLRVAPPGWTHVHTVAEAENFMLHNDVDEASLDHDLGHALDCPGCHLGAHPDTKHIDAPNGKHFVLWLIESGKWPKSRPNVHSQNPVGRETMNQLINRYGPY